MSDLEQEVVEALRHTSSGRDFIMTGGAGSGKTYSMLRFLDELYATNPQASVACITLTNVAVNEVRSRFPTLNLHVSTIHEFLWSLIHRFQKNIRQSLAGLINDEILRSDLETPVTPGFWEHPVKYKERLNLAEGEISHDELLKVANDLFAKHKSLSRILSDKYDYILVDEYQDSPVEVLKIILESLPDPSKRNLRICLFGDSEQAIYEGDKAKVVIEKAIDTGRLNAITKKYNRRNPASVIKVINRLRADGLVQVQASDVHAPNFESQGTARFIYTLNEELNAEKVNNLKVCEAWGCWSDRKLLYLGKSMIAREKQFPQLMAIYDKDRVVDYAKRLEKSLDDKGISIDEKSLFGEIVEAHGSTVKPTPTQQKAFDTDPNILDFAFPFTFRDLVTTSTNSDRLLGTKKVSELDDRDRGSKRDDLINHLVAVEELRSLYRRGKFSAVIRSIDARFTSIEEREQIASSLKTLESMDDSPVGDVIYFAQKSGLVKPKDAALQFQERHPYRYARVALVPFREVSNLYEYVEDYSPYSTQHGVKGSEWDNIFVALDNGGWNNYNFERLMADPQGDSSVHSRSRMMLYVTCSRAKENLLVYVHQPNETTLARAREWFGEDNVECVG